MRPDSLLLLVYDQDALEHPWCDLVYLTDVMAEFDCDVFFPEFDRGLFKEQEGYVFISFSDHYSAGRPDLEAEPAGGERLMVKQLQKRAFYI